MITTIPPRRIEIRLDKGESIIARPDRVVYASGELERRSKIALEQYIATQDGQAVTLAFYGSETAVDLTSGSVIVRSQSLLGARNAVLLAGAEDCDGTWLMLSGSGGQKPRTASMAWIRSHAGFEEIRLAKGEIFLVDMERLAAVASSEAHCRRFYGKGLAELKGPIRAWIVREEQEFEQRIV